MFYNQTLLKDGAFIMCEDASEYDEIVPSPDVTPVQQALKEEKGYDPVLKIYNKMRPYYERIKTFYSYMTPPEDVRTMVVNLEQLSDFASEIVDKLRICEVKMSAMHHAADHDEFTLEPIVQNLGIINKNKNELIRRGYSEVGCNITSLDLISDYQIDKLVNVIDTLGYGKKVTISIDQLADICRWDTNDILNAFNTLEELFDALFDDTTRIRMERASIVSRHINDVISSVYAINSIEKPCRREIETKHMFIKHASRQLRYIKVSLNELIIDAPDMEYAEARMRYVDVVRNAIVAIMDLFYVGMIDLSCKAYQVKRCMDVRNCYEDYVRSIKSELKT